MPSLVCKFRLSGENPATLVGLGNITDLKPALAARGTTTIGLVYRGVRGAVMIAILAITALGLLLGDVRWGGVMCSGIAPTFLEMNIADVFQVSMISVVFAFLFVDLFDTAGTLVGGNQS